jgi:cation transport regulator
MPYKNNADLPDKVKNHLPAHAQSIYREAFNHAWQTYQDPTKRAHNVSREETAHRVAWAAVEKKYAKTKEGAWKEKADS